MNTAEALTDFLAGLTNAARSKLRRVEARPGEGDDAVRLVVTYDSGNREHPVAALGVRVLRTREDAQRAAADLNRAG
ncbi:MAG: hypothetical protein EKK55_07390 [Rhodocyclaceae bacterium]|nr:MAG: hypothetical protein EKK55_07390 [Rhodocyclaceae bacterium]